MSLPSSVKYLVIGAGIHGLSTAYHLALRNKRGAEIIVLDKSKIASGASGIACGVIRNNYFQPAMHELMIHSIEAWEKDADRYTYKSRGYMQICPEFMHAGVEQIASRHKAVGFDCEFIQGEDACMSYMRNMFDDWQASGITTILHEKRGGFANNVPSMLALAEKCREQGVRIFEDVKVTGFTFDNSGAVKSVETEQGEIAIDYLVVGVGPWIKHIWEMLDLPSKIDVNCGNGRIDKGVPMWIYWSLQEGVLGLDHEILRSNDGSLPPVLHVDSDRPLYDEDKKMISEGIWGIYYKPDAYLGGIQGGTAPLKVATAPDDVAVDPYGSKSPDFVVGKDFADKWCAALAHCHKRFEGKRKAYKDVPSGGIGAFTPDSFPVFDVFRQNCYIVADSNHGYKMLGVGDLVAQEICGEESSLLRPFRFNRYNKGQTHPVSSSPFPWS